MEDICGLLIGEEEQLASHSINFKVAHHIVHGFSTQLVNAFFLGSNGFGRLSFIFYISVDEKITCPVFELWCIGVDIGTIPTANEVV